MDFRSPGQTLRSAVKHLAVDPSETGVNDDKSVEAMLENRDMKGLVDGSGPIGIDHNYNLCASGDGKELIPACTLLEPNTKRSLKIRTSAPGLQCYTANWLDGLSLKGKNGRKYRQWDGVAFETQTFPDSIGGEKGDEVFEKGRTVILENVDSKREYLHESEFEFGWTV